MKKYYKILGMGFCGHSPLITSNFLLCANVPRAFYSFTNWTGLTYNYKFVGLNNFKASLWIKIHECDWLYCNHQIAMVVGEIALGIFIARVLNSKIKPNLLPCLVLLPSSFVWFDSGSDFQTSLQLRSSNNWECPSYRVSSNQSFRD